MPPRRSAAITYNFFPTGDHLPLFSGAPPRPVERPFSPEATTTQGAFFNLRPDPFHTLGGVLPALQPTEEVTHDNACEATQCDAHPDAGAAPDKACASAGN